ncbi:DNA-binding domain-containing protein [Iodidimonas sp. SYSU 1G8]|uniref:DNA-binding domain-containing protein n=1 Tax=Iodidimonas sp. SYSU 1G8 TaxID=3133967 RepID=UPI0031FEC5C6
MHELAEVQARLSASIRNGGVIAPMLTPGIPAEASIAIYRNNMYARFVDALADTFPATQRIVGADFFRFAALEFVDAHPCRSGTLIGYGREFPGFLRHFEPAHALAYLTDVAALEFLHRESYHAADTPALDALALHEMAARDGDALRVALHASGRLLETRYRVLELWRANLADSPPSLQLAAGGERLLIVRPEAEVTVFRLSEAAFVLLAAIRDGLSVGDALAVSADKEGGQDLTMDLAQLISSGVFTLPQTDPAP